MNDLSALADKLAALSVSDDMFDAGAWTELPPSQLKSGDANRMK